MVPSATISTPPPPLPPLLPLLPPPLVDAEDDACYMNPDSSPASLVHAICRALKARLSSDQPLPASHMVSKGGDDDGGTSGGGQSWIAHRIGMVLSTPPRGGVMATRVAGK
jgi:hypothetical protein